MFERRADPRVGVRGPDQALLGRRCDHVPLIDQDRLQRAGAVADHIEQPVDLADRLRM